MLQLSKKSYSLSVFLTIVPLPLGHPIFFWQRPSAGTWRLSIEQLYTSAFSAWQLILILLVPHKQASYVLAIMRVVIGSTLPQYQQSGKGYGSHIKNFLTFTESLTYCKSLTV